MVPHLENKSIYSIDFTGQSIDFIGWRHGNMNQFIQLIFTGQSIDFIGWRHGNQLADKLLATKN